MFGTGDPYARDNSGRRINSRGEVLDVMGNVVDNVGVEGYASARNNNNIFGAKTQDIFGATVQPNNNSSSAEETGAVLAQGIGGLIGFIFSFLFNTGFGFILSGGALLIASMVLPYGLVATLLAPYLPEGISILVGGVVGFALGLLTLYWINTRFSRRNWLISGALFMGGIAFFLVGGVFGGIANLIPWVNQFSTEISLVTGLLGGFTAFCWRAFVDGFRQGVRSRETPPPDQAEAA